MQEADPQPHAETPAVSPFAEQLRVPQFGILHLMIWTAVTAVLLKYFLTMEELQSQLLSQTPGERRLSVMRVLQSVHAIIFASTLVGSAILIRARCRTAKPFQPGHWLVLLLAIGGVLQLISWPVGLYLAAASPQRFWLFAVENAVVAALTAAMYVIAVLQLRDARRWKILLGAVALENVAAAVMIVVPLVAGSGYFSDLIFSSWRWNRACSIAWPVALLVMLLAVAVSDLPRRALRDWLHWLGVGVFVLNLFLVSAWHVYFAFFVQVAIGR
jgi:hypothetical protein